VNQKTEASLDLVGRRRSLQLAATLITMASVHRDGVYTILTLADSFQQGGELIPARSALDHLLLGVARLEDGIAWVEEQTGVKAAPGGNHPGAGTHNALLSLGHRQYVEIIAPDPNQTYTGPLASLLKELEMPKPITWAAATKDIELLAKKLRGSGVAIDGPQPGSRTRPDGRQLEWKTLRLTGQPYGLVPFFIEWASDTVHPSVDSPSGCQLTGLELYHPEPNLTGQMMRKLSIAAEIKKSIEPGLKVQLDCPKGRVFFG